jgi:hypothetical protein
MMQGMGTRAMSSDGGFAGPAADAAQLSLFDARSTDTGWRVRASQRARRLSARVFRDGSVEIVVPAGTRAATVTAFVARHRRWIDRQCSRAVRPEPGSFPPAAIELPAIDEHWTCVPGGGRRAVVELADTSCATGGMLQLDVGRAPEELRAALFDWLCARATLRLQPALQSVADAIGLRFARLQIRRQRTRWGSCSTRGTISLNCALLFQRPEVLRYLLVHELSHLRHMHHGPRFWAHVARYEPDWRTLDRELREGWRRVPAWALVGRS